MNGLAWTLGLIAAAPALLAHGAAADDIRAASAIESVVVFPSTADVTRTGEVRIPAGEHRIIFSGLPQYLDANSLRVRFGSSAIVVGAVEAVSAFPEGGGPELAQALRDQLQGVQDEIQTVDDRIATAELQLQFLQGQTGAPKTDTATGGVDPASWAAALNAIEAGSQDARAAILAARQERRLLERQAQEIQLQVDRINDDLAMRTDVQVALTATQAVTAPLELQYQAPAAGWNALYEARLDSEDASLTLERKIQVYQNSGEDWTRVQLSVSTAPPSYQMDAPYVGTQYLSLMEPQPPAGRGLATAAPAPADLDQLPQFETAEEVVVTGSRLRRDEYSANSPIVAVDASFASTYGVGGLVDVLSDNTPRTFTIGQEDVEIELAIRAAPRWSLDAFVIAKLTYDGAGPLPPGSLRLYRDGAYLTSSYLNTLIPGEEIELGFGVDQQVVVTWVNEGGKESETGLIGRATQVVEDHRFEALNRHSTPFTVEVIDYRPIAQDDDIQVRVDPESTPPDETDFDDRPGVLLWRRELQPDETLTVRNAYTIVHPTNEILVGR